MPNEFGHPTIEDYINDYWSPVPESKNIEDRRGDYYRPLAETRLQQKATQIMPNSVDLAHTTTGEEAEALQELIKVLRGLP